MTMEVVRGDALRIMALNVRHAALGMVTSGLTGTLRLTNQLGVEVLSVPVLEHIGDDWYVDITAPMTPGMYRATITLSSSGAQRTLHEDIFVS